MVAMLAFGGTFAYFTATTSAKSATLTTGKVSLKANDTVKFEQETGTIVPGDTLVKGDIAYTNDSTVDTYVAIVFKYTSENATTEQLAELKKAIAVNTNTTNWEETATGSGIFVYKKAAGDYKLAANTADALTFVSDGIKFSETYKENFKDGVSEATTSIENLTFTISFQAYAIQAKNIVEDAPTTAAAVWTAMNAQLNVTV